MKGRNKEQRTKKRRDTVTAGGTLQLFLLLTSFVTILYR